MQRGQLPVAVRVRIGHNRQECRDGAVYIRHARHETRQVVLGRLIFSIGWYFCEGNTSNEAVLVYELLDVPLGNHHLTISMTFFH